MRVLAVDPGPETSGVVLWDGSRVLAAEAKRANEIIFNDGTLFDPGYADATVFEKIESFGMIVGASVFETAFETGRLYQWAATRGCPKIKRIPRREVKLHICGSSRAKDANIRQALIDKYGPVGTKKNPGPLYGVKSHAWSALALAVTYMETRA